MTVSTELKALYTDSNQHNYKYNIEFYNFMDSSTAILTLDNASLKTESIELSEGLCDGDLITVGDVYTSQITFDAADVSTALCGKYMRVYQTVDNLSEKLEIGRFIVTSVSKTSDRRMKTITGYDYTCLFDEDGSNLLKSMAECETVAEALTLISDHFSLSWGASGAPGGGAALSWDYSQVEGEDCTVRDLVRMLGQLLGGWIKADREGNLYLRTVAAPTSSMEAVTVFRSAPDHEEYLVSAYDNVTFTDADGTIYQADSTGAKPYDLSGNFFLTGGEKNIIRQHLSRCLDGIKNITYYPCKMTIDARPWLLPGDYVKFTDGGEELYTIIKVRTLKGIQSQKDTYEADGIDASVVNYTSRSQQQENLYIIRERYERKKMQQDLEDKLNSTSGMYLSAEYNDAGEAVAYYIRDKADASEATLVIKVSMQAIGLSTDGGLTYPFGATINGEVIASILDAIGINANWIRTGDLTVGGTSANADGSIKVYDANDKLICRIDKTGLMALLGEIGGWQITDNAITSPDSTLRLDSESGTITGYEDGKRRVQLGKQGIKNYDAQGNLIGLTGVTDLYGVNADGTINYNDFKGSLMSAAVEDDAVGWAVTAKVDGSGIEAKQRRVWYDRATDTFRINCKTELSGGFNSGTRIMEQTVLWEGIAQEGSSITLTDSIRNYDAIVAFACISPADSGQKEQFSSIVIPSASYDYKSTVANEENWGFVINLSRAQDNRRVVFNITGNNTITIGAAEGIAALSSVIGLKFISRINYSTSEQRIGTWVDGKPLYQKTITAQDVTSQKYGSKYAFLVADLSSLNIDLPIGVVNGAFKYSTWNFNSVPYTSKWDIGESLDWHYTKDQINMVHVANDSNGYGTMQEIVVTIQYTKTTD